MVKKSQEALKVVKQLRKQKKTVAVAESLTGGGLGACLTQIPGSSEIFLGGVIAYTNGSKTKLLGIPTSLLKKKSAVSEEVAILMAKNIRTYFSSNIGVSTTGVAGPGSAYGQKPGTVWIGISTKKESFAIELSLRGDRETVRRETITCALAALERILAL